MVELLSVSEAEWGNISRHLAALSHSPFVMAYATTLSPHAGTAFD